MDQLELSQETLSTAMDSLTKYVMKLTAGSVTSISHADYSPEVPARKNHTYSAPVSEEVELPSAPSTNTIDFISDQPRETATGLPLDEVLTSDPSSVNGRLDLSNGASMSESVIVETRLDSSNDAPISESAIIEAGPDSPNDKPISELATGGARLESATVETVPESMIVGAGLVSHSVELISDPVIIEARSVPSGLDPTARD